MARKKNQTRIKLMDAALELILASGYEDVMTDEIAELADVGRRTFYNHFSNKHECVMTAVKERYASYAKKFTDNINTPTTEQADIAKVIAIMASNMFQIIASDPVTEKLKHYPLILNEAIAESQRDFITANIAKGAVSGRLTLSFPPEILEPIASWGFVGLVITAIDRNSQVKDSYIWAEFILKNLSLDDTEISKLIIAIKR